MNKYRYTVLGIFLIFSIGVTQLQAAESDTQGDLRFSEEAFTDIRVAAGVSDYVYALLHNQYLLENARLIVLAEDSFTEGKYDDAVVYANEANKYAQLSDDYVSLQIKIRETNEAIADAEARLEWAQGIGAPSRYAETYEDAETALGEALNFRSNDDWDEARESALHVITILALIPEDPKPEDPKPTESFLPAQYLVKSWFTTKDCLWNIAAKPEIYGDPWQWRLIYNANRDKMPRPNDPDLIHPGMILDIPSIRGEVRAGIMEE